MLTAALNFATTLVPRTQQASASHLDYLLGRPVWAPAHNDNIGARCARRVMLSPQAKHLVGCDRPHQGAEILRPCCEKLARNGVRTQSSFSYLGGAALGHVHSVQRHGDIAGCRGRCEDGGLARGATRSEAHAQAVSRSADPRATIR